MENLDRENQQRRHFDDNNRNPFNQPNKSKWVGVFIIIIGCGVLLRNIPQTANILPYWLFTWPMILILVGLYSLIKHKNKNPLSWVIPLLIGTYFLVRGQFDFSINSDRFLLPAILIIVGIVLFFRRNNSRNFSNQNRLIDGPQNDSVDFPKDKEDYLNINTTFGSAKKIILSKKFKGGTINCSFGGAEIDLTQADIQGTVILNFSIIAGGAELFVPSNWEIQNNVNVALGGIEDKRRRFNQSEEQQKILVLEGSISLGGLEIKN